MRELTQFRAGPRERSPVKTVLMRWGGSRFALADTTSQLYEFDRDGIPVKFHILDVPSKEGVESEPFIDSIHKMTNGLGDVGWGSHLRRS